MEFGFNGNAIKPCNARKSLIVVYMGRVVLCTHVYLFTSQDGATIVNFSDFQRTCLCGFLNNMYTHQKVFCVVLMGAFNLRTLPVVETPSRRHFQYLVEISNMHAAYSYSQTVADRGRPAVLLIAGQ